MEVKHMEEENIPSSPLSLRILKHFEDIPEAPFWPTDITSVMDMLMSPVSFKEMSDFLTDDHHRTVNHLEDAMDKYKINYNRSIEQFKKMKNVFSYDIDYI